MRIILRIASLILLVFSLAWMWFDFGWDSVSGSLTAGIGFLATFVHSRTTDIQPHLSETPLSADAKILLQEIDQTEKSPLKGITIIMTDPFSGIYLPYVWSQNLHGVIHGQPSNMQTVLASVEELRDLEFIKTFKDSEETRIFTRTTKSA